MIANSGQMMIEHIDMQIGNMKKQTINTKDVSKSVQIISKWIFSSVNIVARMQIDIFSYLNFLFFPVDVTFYC